MKAKTLREWRSLVLKRDEYTCQLCSVPANVADHIRPRSLAPNLTLETSNGRALCHSCHARHGSRHSRGIGQRLCSTVIARLARVCKIEDSLIVTVALPSELVKRYGIQEGDNIGVFANSSIIKVVPVE